MRMERVKSIGVGLSRNPALVALNTLLLFGVLKVEAGSNPGRMCSHEVTVWPGAHSGVLNGAVCEGAGSVVFSPGNWTCKCGKGGALHPAIAAGDSYAHTATTIPYDPLGRRFGTVEWKTNCDCAVASTIESYDFSVMEISNITANLGGVVSVATSSSSAPHVVVPQNAPLVLTAHPCPDVGVGGSLAWKPVWNTGANDVALPIDTATVSANSDGTTYWAESCGERIYIKVVVASVEVVATNGVYDAEDLLAVGTSRDFAAVVTPPGLIGTYYWPPDSGKITVGSPTSPLVTVTAGDQASAAMNAEVLKAVFTPAGNEGVELPGLFSLTVVAVETVTATDESDAGNTRTSDDSDPQDLDVGYTEDGAGNSTTKFTLAATTTPQNGGQPLWPDNCPSWVIRDGTGAAVPVAANDVTAAGFMPTRYSCVAVCGSSSVTGLVDVLKVDIEQTNVCVGADMSTNVWMNLTSASHTNVTWELEPSGLPGGASLVGNVGGTNVEIATGTVPTNYTVRAYADERTSCCDTATLSVVAVDIEQTNVYVGVGMTTNATLDLASGSVTDVVWKIEPVLADGARFADGITNSGSATTASGTNVWVFPGTVGTNYTVTAYAANLTNCSDTATVSVVKVEFNLLWATQNKANQIFNPTRKDDPADNDPSNPLSQRDANDDTYGTPRNNLYLVPDPADSKYKATVKADIEPASVRPKIIASVYAGSSKVSGSDKAFDTSGECAIEFTHTGADIQDFTVKVGFDANGNNQLDQTPSEIMPFVVKSPATGQAIGDPIIRGTSPSRYNAVKGYIDNTISVYARPHAAELLRIFRDGNAAGVPAELQPLLPPGTRALNAMGGPFSEWLTHNSGAPFSDSAQVTLNEYSWEYPSETSALIGDAKEMRAAINDYYNTTVKADAMATLPVGSTAWYPSDTGWYTISHPHSPAWVPQATVELHDNNPLTPPAADDVNGTVGRGRVTSHQARYRITKKLEILPPFAEYLEVEQVRSVGEVLDLYDFNYESAGMIPAAQWAATLQIGYGKGAYGSNRDRGKIFFSRFAFDITYPGGLP